MFTVLYVLAVIAYGYVGFYLLWFVWRGWKTREALTNIGPVPFNRRPIAFGFTLAVQLALALCALAMAAGYFRE